MNEAAVLSLIMMFGWLLLAGSAFASYRLSWGKTAQLGLVWVAIFVGLFLLVRLLGLEL
ncbi:MAG: hypothetical protein AAGA34_02915 [Pseudomonadota bacterium]